MLRQKRAQVGTKSVQLRGLRDIEPSVLRLVAAIPERTLDVTIPPLQSSITRGVEPRGQPTRSILQRASVSFAYVGNTRMTVVGAVSGYQYSFDRPGARLYVDPRDRAGLASIRQLRQVR